MTRERELLRHLQATLEASDVDAETLVAEASDEARAEVRDTLRRLMTRDLLERALATLEGGPATEDPRDAPPGAGDEVRVPADSHDAMCAGRGVEEQRSTPRPGTTATWTYVFGVTGDDGAPDPPDPRRLPDGGAPRWLSETGTRALVCDVEPATFEVLQQPGSAGLDTLAAVAHAHDEVLAALATATTVLPLRLGTVVPDDDAVRHLLTAHGDRLRSELGRMAGKAEWSVTVQLSDGAEPDDDRAREASSGADYLQRRRDALDARSHRGERRRQLAISLHERLALCAQAADTVTARPVDDVAPPLLHGVYLLADDAVASLERLVADLRAEHPRTVIEITGPWPPYHFTSADLILSEDAGG